MDDIPPPPPYSISDPERSNSSTSSRSSYLPRYLSSLNTQLFNRNPSVSRQVRQSSAPTPSPIFDQYSTPAAAAPASTLPRTAIVPNPVSKSDSSTGGFVSAASYFELRTPTQERPRNKFFHHMSIRPDARTESFPFPLPRASWENRGVDEIDWTTFIKFLLLWPGVEGLNAGESRSRVSDEHHVRRLHIEKTGVEWNAGFFGPRGLEICIEFADSAFTKNAPLPVSRRSTSSVLQKKVPAEKEESFLHQAVAKGKKSHVKLLLDTASEDIEALNRKSETCLYRAVCKGDKEIVQLLLENGANPHARPSGADSALHIACSSDKKSIVKYLLEASADGTEEMNGKGETALYVAVNKGRKDRVELLLEAGADPNSKPGGRDSMLNLAVTNDSKSVAKLLLQNGADVEEQKGGETPLCRAISRGATSLVKLLLEHHASTIPRNVKGEPPLSLAITRGSKDMVALLLSSPDINIEVPNRKTETPLWSAIYQSHTSIAESLLRAGAHPNKHPPGEESCLNLAVSRDNSSLVHALLDRGAEADVKNRSGETPLFQAAGRENTSTVSLLLAKGADPNTRNIAGESVLQKAVGRNSTSIVSLLLGAGADADLQIACGESPLYMAVHRTSTSIVSILLSHGANPESRSSAGEMPLWRAIYTSNTSIVSLLLSRGADPASKTMSGDSMYEYAVKKGNKTIVLLLQNHRVTRGDEKVLLVDGMGLKDGLGKAEKR